MMAPVLPSSVGAAPGRLHDEPPLAALPHAAATVAEMKAKAPAAQPDEVESASQSSS